MRKASLLLVGAFAAATIGACSSGSSTSTGSSAAPTTTAAAGGGGGSSTTKAGGTTSGSGAKKTPTVTKPASPQKVEKDKLPAKAQKADQFAGLTEDEKTCIDYVVYTAVTDDPSLAADDASLAGLTGATLVVCVGQEKIAADLAQEIQKSNPSVTSEQASCIQQGVASSDPQNLAVFIGILALNDPELTKTVGQGFATAVDEKCGTKLAAAG